MKMRTIIGIVIGITLSFSVLARTLEGFWIANQGEAVGEVIGNRILISLLNLDETQYVVEIEQIDETRFELKANGMNVPSFFTVYWDSQTFTIPDLSGNTDKLVFRPAPQISKSDLEGIWYTTEENTRDGSIKTVTEYKDGLGNYRTVDIENDLEIYSTRYMDFEPYQFENGFVFLETYDDEVFKAYIVEFNGDVMTIASSPGLSWEEFRGDESTELYIPEDYKEVSREEYWELFMESLGID